MPKDMTRVDNQGRRGKADFEFQVSWFSRNWSGAVLS